MKEYFKDPLVREAKEKFEQIGVEAVLFDLDDTLIYTAEIFGRQMDEYCEFLAEEMGLDIGIIKRRIQEINDEEYKKMGVSPDRWRSVLEKLAVSLEFPSEKVMEGLDILMRIYSTEPRPRPGLRSLLEVLKNIDMKMVLVTHANVEWTYFKMDSLELWEYFDVVIIADENGHKGIEDWKKGMESVKVTPDRCLVVGDNLRGDILPSDELGARTVWMPSPWSVYRAGKAPDRTVQIADLDEMLAVVADMG